MVKSDDCGYNSHSSAGDYPNLTCDYSQEEGTDYEQPIIGCNGMRDELISRKVCYDQVIYDDDMVEMNETTRLRMKIRNGPYFIDFDDAYTIITIVDYNDSESHCW